MDSDGVEEDVRRRAHGARSGRRAETHGRDARGESHDGLHGRAGMLPAATTCEANEADSRATLGETRMCAARLFHNPSHLNPSPAVPSMSGPCIQTRRFVG